jgi:hypothetical protein
VISDLVSWFTTSLTPRTHAWRTTGNDVGYDFDYTDAGGATMIQEFAYQNGRVRVASLLSAAAWLCTMHKQCCEHN